MCVRVCVEWVNSEYIIVLVVEYTKANNTLVRVLFLISSCNCKKL